MPKQSLPNQNRQYILCDSKKRFDDCDADAYADGDGHGDGDGHAGHGDDDDGY